MIKVKEYLLVKIKPDQVSVEDLQTGKSVNSNLKFSNDRLLITNPYEPESTLKDLINQITANTLITFNRAIIINPYHPAIHEFTEMEKMVFRDLAVNLGAKEVRFIFGKDISGGQLDVRFLENQTVV
jgi:hypothetical protein